MSKKDARAKQKTYKEKIIDSLHRYAYTETIVITLLYLAIGYLINPNDIVMIEKDAPYLLMLLTLITLFHGFENGVLALTITTLAMWHFYDPFPYLSFLVALIMTMLFSEFHRYWTRQIHQLQLETEYKTRKINELSRAFYTLKISHDQLEKNYVIKPMSIRNSLEHILQKEIQTEGDITVKDKIDQHAKDFLELLQKSFNLKDAQIICLNTLRCDPSEDIDFFKQNAKLISKTPQADTTLQKIFEEDLVDQALSKRRAVYISDESGNPSFANASDTTYLAVMPSYFEGKLLGILLIKELPFMAFNKENLTAIAILLDYFLIEMNNKAYLLENDYLPYVKEKEFAVEFTRLKYIFDHYRVNTASIVLKTKSKLHARRLYELITKILRTLDMVTFVETDTSYDILIMLVLNDRAAAEGFLNRFRTNLKTKEDQAFEVMYFDMQTIDEMNEYIQKEYTYVETA